MVNKRILSVWAGMAAAGFGLAPAHAQQAAETAQAASNGGLENIVVTAQKRQENVQQVPIAIEAFNEHQIDALQITNLDAVAQNSPGLELTRNLGAAQFALRGIGGFGITPGIESDVALYIDGIYYPATQSANFSFNNIAHTEVDKGPQGTLFGRNALGGVVSLTTKDPTQTPHIDASVGYGNYNTVTGNFYATTGITPDLAADIAIYGENQSDGWGKNLWNGSQLHTSREWSGRSKWLFTPDDATKFTFIIDYDRSVPATVGPNFIPGTGGGYGSLINFGPRHIGGFYDSYLPNQQYVDNTGYGGSLTAEHDFGWADGKSISSWRKNRSRQANPAIQLPPYTPATPLLGQIPGDTVISYSTWDEQDASQEFQLLSPTSEALKWIGGVFLYEDQAVMDPRKSSTSAAPQAPSYDDARQDTFSYAAFGQATAPVTTDTRVTVGYRYTIDIRQLSGNTYNQAGAITQNSGNNPGGQHKRWPKQTYKLAIDHDFTSNVLGYISYSRGFQSGAFNIVAGPLAPPVNPETLDAYEAGFKSDLLDNKLRVNVSAFYYQLRNYVATQYVNNAPVTVNAAAAEFKGIDADITYAPVQNLTFGFGIDLLDPKYTNFPGAQFFNTGAAGVCGTTTTACVWVPTPGNGAGNQVAYTEKVESTASAQYRIPTDMGDFFLAADVGYHSGIVFDVQGREQQPSYFLVDASATWTAPSAQWDVKLWSKNLTGTEYVESMGTNTSQFTLNPAPPRTFGVTVGWHWDGAPAETPYTAPAAPVAAVTPPPAAPAPAPEVQRAFQVFFDFDKSDVTDAAAKVIQAAAANVKAGHVTRINVTGHTDTVGSAAYNQGLSERRAAAVKQQLVSDGVSDGDISTVGVGKTGLLVPTADGVREPQNRRAEIVLQ